MSINPIGGCRFEPPPRVLRRSASHSGFAVPDQAEAAPQPGEVAAEAGTSGLEALLALQQANTAQERNRRAHRRASKLLDGLRKLQLIFLGDPAETLTIGELSQLSAEAGAAGRDAADPGLRDVVAEIELEAERHLARIRAGATQLAGTTSPSS